jgi:hypothetical protein
LDARALPRKNNIIYKTTDLNAMFFCSPMLIYFFLSCCLLTFLSVKKLICFTSDQWHPIHWIVMTEVSQLNSPRNLTTLYILHSCCYPAVSQCLPMYSLLSRGIFDKIHVTFTLFHLSTPPPPYLTLFVIFTS